MIVYICLERDANAFYESAEVKKMKQEQLISNLRKQNKNKRIELAKTMKVNNCTLNRSSK